MPEDRQHHGLVLPLDITDNVTLPILSRFTRRGWLASSGARQAAYDAATQMEVKAATVWQKARELVEQCRKLSGASQKLYDLHLARIAYFEANPPSQDWDGAFRPILR